MGRAVLPSPASLTNRRQALTDSGESPRGESAPNGVGVMILVTGRVQGDDRGGDGFVELWAGLAGKRPHTKGKASMERVQAPGKLGRHPLRAWVLLNAHRRSSRCEHIVLAV